jgi:hypothetical protein
MGCSYPCYAGVWGIGDAAPPFIGGCVPYLLPDLTDCPPEVPIVAEGE